MIHINEFIAKPFLPNNKVTLAAVSFQNESVVRALEELGIQTLKVYPYKNLISNPEASHADMQLLPVGGNTVIIVKGSNLIDCNLKNEGFSVKTTCEEIYDFKYPSCVKLNCAIINDKIICNKKYADKSVENKFQNKTLINVNQGYTKCSTAIVEGNAIITSDISIYNAAVKNKIDCLKISEGGISLCESYGGFIGGACFKADKDTLAFTGDVRKHPDYISIKAFCLNYGVNLLSICGGILTDIGGVIPLKEKSSV